MSALGTELPSLDSHAHVAPDVTKTQLATLGKAHIFAVTRSLQEAAVVASRTDSQLTWGIGIHPGVPAARAAYNPDKFRQLLSKFALVGEVGLDRRGPRDEQEKILTDILVACHDQPVFLSLHSTGRTGQILEVLERNPHPGAILHWFLGQPDEIARAEHAGAYFSVNSAMSDDLLEGLPRARVLTETDFPARQVRARVPGETQQVEDQLSKIWRISKSEVRHQIWMNLKRAAIDSGAIERVSDTLADTLLTL
ncbi:TatD family hydrolase [Arthrobacter psychrochitiniphilus]|uniref:TatD family hydrolase n=1 Tax=Arthrobacter psychrochitiniphilus TaxID=291045 RepID=UPI003F7CA1EF